MKSFKLAFCAVLCSLGGGVTPLASAQYYVWDLGTLPGSGMSFTTGINDNGQVVGWSNFGGRTEAFIYSGGVMSSLGTLGTGSSYIGSSYAADINNAGQVVGWSDWASSNGTVYYRAFMYEGSMMQNLGILPGASDSVASGINNSGQVVGRSYSGVNNVFLYSGGAMTALGISSSPVVKINDAGQVLGNKRAGENPFIFSGGVTIDIGSLGGLHTWANAINNNGDVVGASDLSGTTTEAHPFFYSYSTGTMQDLGLLAAASQSWAEGLNDLGQVVGRSFMGNGGWHAFLYSEGLMQDLNSLVDPDYGWVIQAATDINEYGQIAAYGYNSIFGGSHALLLDTVPDPNAPPPPCASCGPPPTPVPEPSTYAMLLAGLGLLGFIARRRNQQAA